MVVAAGLPAQLGPERNCGSVRVTSRSVVVPSNCNLPLTTTLPAASVPTPMSPPQPPNLSAGHLLPDPEQIRQRELECMESLDVQLDELKQTLSWRLKQRSDCLYKEADKQKAELCMQVDQRVKEQALQLSREHNDQLLLLQQSKAKKRGRQTAQQQKLALKQRSTQLLLDYHHQQAEEELMQERYNSQLFQHGLEAEHRQCMDDLGSCIERSYTGSRPRCGRLQARSNASAGRRSRSCSPSRRSLRSSCWSSARSWSSWGPLRRSWRRRCTGCPRTRLYQPPRSTGLRPPPLSWGCRRFMGRPHLCRARSTCSGTAAGRRCASPMAGSRRRRPSLSPKHRRSVSSVGFRGAGAAGSRKVGEDNSASMDFLDAWSFCLSGHV
mmetsp:Transcript_96076/g.309892  ORF Transcript_96076/g.309892 Transcript_96076/m.309892 type:complete len:382 (+) Transcript_96076:1584-2729(+)